MAFGNCCLAFGRDRRLDADIPPLHFVKCVIHRPNIARVKPARPAIVAPPGSGSNPAAFHSMTSSARPRIASGTTTSIALAVLRLTIIGTLPDVPPAGQLGRAPWIIRCTYSAARRKTAKPQIRAESDKAKPPSRA